MAQPICLYHYTSVGVLCKLFTNIKNGNFIFHASSVDSMNDNAEYVIASNQCKDIVEKIVMNKELGIPFALCFSERGDNIPMWNMYANSGKGVCLKFNYTKLKKYFKEYKKIDKRNKVFSRCVYKNIDFNEKPKPFNISNEYPNTPELNQRMEKAAFIKPKCFSHEEEWRIMVWQDWTQKGKNKILFKEKQDELCPYVEIPIPVNCLEMIILKPSANEGMISATQILRTIYGVDGGCGISVEKSRITLK